MVRVDWTHLSFADLDECEAGSSCCEQDCTNYPGGYECYCRAGYRLNADGCGCDGMHWPIHSPLKHCLFLCHKNCQWQQNDSACVTSFMKLLHFHLCLVSHWDVCSREVIDLESACDDWKLVLSFRCSAYLNTNTNNISKSNMSDTENACNLWVW